jgi:hypothetical protein
VNYHHNIWQIGAPHKTEFTSALSAPNVIVTDTINPYPANDTSVFILKVPFRRPIPGWGLSAPVNVQFYYQLQKDTGSLALLEVSQDSGLHLYNVNDSLPSLLSSSGSSLPDLSDTTSSWSLFSINFNTLALFGISPGDSFLFRFTFISDSVTPGKDGWMVDNIGLYYYWEGIPQIVNNNLISIYPNPTKGNIYIHPNGQDAKNGSVSIYNMQGQEVYSMNQLPSGGYLDLPVPDGIYTLRYSAEDEFCTKQIVVER